MALPILQMSYTFMEGGRENGFSSRLSTFILIVLKTGVSNQY
jgi:hypothetical protein